MRENEPLDITWSFIKKGFFGTLTSALTGDDGGRGGFDGGLDYIMSQGHSKSDAQRMLYGFLSERNQENTLPIAGEGEGEPDLPDTKDSAND